MEKVCEQSNPCSTAMSLGTGSLIVLVLCSWNQLPEIDRNHALVNESNTCQCDRMRDAQILNVVVKL